MLHALQPAWALGVVALSILLRDLGNGVVRVEVEGWHFLERPTYGGGEPLAAPFPSVVADAIACALCALGSHREFTAGRSRSVADDLTEICVW